MTDTVNVAELLSQPLSEALKVYSRKTHDSVDEAVMSNQPFASQENYAKFLQTQHEFHETVRSLYGDAELNQQLPSLDTLGRADKVQDDMQALNVQPAKIDVARPTIEGAKRIGWLYCVEGSNIGAAILYKEAGKIQLDESHGASHLAAHPDGRKAHWLAFKALLDNLQLSDEDKQLALQGSDDAFAYYKDVLKAVFQA